LRSQKTDFEALENQHLEKLENFELWKNPQLENGGDPSSNLGGGIELKVQD